MSSQNRMRVEIGKIKMNDSSIKVSCYCQVKGMNAQRCRSQRFYDPKYKQMERGGGEMAIW